MQIEIHEEHPRTLASEAGGEMHGHRRFERPAFGVGDGEDLQYFAAA